VSLHDVNVYCCGHSHLHASLHSYSGFVCMHVCGRGRPYWT